MTEGSKAYQRWLEKQFNDQLAPLSEQERQQAVAQVSAAERREMRQGTERPLRALNVRQKRAARKKYHWDPL